MGKHYFFRMLFVVLSCMPFFKSYAIYSFKSMDTFMHDCKNYDSKNYDDPRTALCGYYVQGVVDGLLYNLDLYNDMACYKMAYPYITIGKIVNKSLDYLNKNSITAGAPAETISYVYLKEFPVPTKCAKKNYDSLPGKMAQPSDSDALREAAQLVEDEHKARLERNRAEAEYYRAQAEYYKNLTRKNNK